MKQWGDLPGEISDRMKYAVYRSGHIMTRLTAGEVPDAPPTGVSPEEDELNQLAAEDPSAESAAPLQQFAQAKTVPPNASSLQFPSTPVSHGSGAAHATSSLQFPAVPVGVGGPQFPSVPAAASAGQGSGFAFPSVPSAAPAAHSQQQLSSLPSVPAAPLGGFASGLSGLSFPSVPSAQQSQPMNFPSVPGTSGAASAASVPQHLAFPSVPAAAHTAPPPAAAHPPHAASDASLHFPSIPHHQQRPNDLDFEIPSAPIGHHVAAPHGADLPPPPAYSASVTSAGSMAGPPQGNPSDLLRFADQRPAPSGGAPAPTQHPPAARAEPTRAVPDTSNKAATMTTYDYDGDVFGDLDMPEAPGVQFGQQPQHFRPSMKEVNEAQRLTKMANSALNFEDVPTAVDNLCGALKNLTGIHYKITPVEKKPAGQRK